ncbi:IS5 family transposase [Solemya velum gill symbiont]|uniref:IS5 family transposase n=1 Tax=Solemya velum gill symbiont TaxID=2340 RepID=UPI000997B3B4|nr:IS5 family transposase [Solemya velum gill symbiont]OOZ74118.1 IS5 family transposase [Solemya velum gill symbiont]
MQPNFFAHEDRLELHERLGDPLPKLDKTVQWEAFRKLLSPVYRKGDPSKGGRPPFDAVLMFKVLVLQHIYNLSDDQTEFQIRDRYSFCRFLNITPQERVPDAKTIWLFRERLKKLELMEKLFAEILFQIDNAGFTARKGQIVYAAIVPAPRQRNSRDENKQIKSGETPSDWSDAKRSQKDVEARWTKKRGVSHYGYKNHISVDNKHKVIGNYAVTSAEVHDSQVFEELLDENNSSGDVWADSAYRDQAREASLPRSNYRSHIHRKGNRKRPLNWREQEANRKRSKVRARVEHIFAQQANRLVRTIGKARADVKIGMMNIVYNMRRLAWLSG